MLSDDDGYIESNGESSLARVATQIETSRKRLSELIHAGNTLADVSSVKNRGHLLGRLVNVQRRLESLFQDRPEYWKQACSAAECLASSTGNLYSARKIISDLEYHAIRSSPVSYMLRGIFYSLLFILVLSISIYSLGAASEQDIIPPELIKFFWMDHRGYGFAAAFGMIGSIVSIFLNFPKFDGHRRKGKQLLVLSGFCLPYVGLVFGVMVLAIFNAGIITTNYFPHQNQHNYYITCAIIGFVSGFSENFARRILSSVDPSTQQEGG